MKLAVSITADHIARGVRGHCADCPGALAISDAWLAAKGKRPSRVQVSCGYVEVWESTWGLSAAPFDLTATPPDALAQFVVGFDRQHVVTPIQFELEFRPNPMLQQESQDG